MNTTDWPLVGGLSAAGVAPLDVRSALALGLGLLGMVVGILIFKLLVR